MYFSDMLSNCSLNFDTFENKKSKENNDEHAFAYRLAFMPLNIFAIVASSNFFSETQYGRYSWSLLYSLPEI
jgi:hypothetical protein